MKNSSGLGYSSFAGSEESLLVVVERQLNNALDTVAADDTGHTDKDITKAIFALKVSRAGDHLLLVVDDAVNHAGCAGTRSHPCAGTQQTGQRSTAYHSRFHHFVHLLLGQEIGSRHTFVGSKASHRNHGGVAVTADHETFYLVGIAVELLREEIFETAAIECATHTDDAVFGQAGSLQSKVSHGVHGVGYNYEDSVRRIRQDLLSHRLHDAGIHANELLTCHTGFAGQTAGDNHYVGVGSLLIPIGNTLHNGVKTEELSCLHNIHSFAFGNAFFDIDEDYFAGHFLDSQHICTCCAYITGAHNSYF